MGPESTNDSTPPRRRRQICDNCDRPQPVCLCHAIPLTQIPTKTKIIILHHPHESKHKLNTTPLLNRSLLNVTTVISRRLLRSHFHDQSPETTTTIYLFPPSPSAPALTLSQFQSSNFASSQTRPLTLIVFDATWSHAKEMVKASERALRSIGAIRVCLDTGFDENVSGGSIYDSELVLRKEPFSGCVSTMEAVARCLGSLEPDGVEIEEKLIEVLREMVRLQSCFLKPMKPRPRLLKKSKQKEEEEEQLGF